MPLRPFAPSDNDAARPDAVAALAALLKKRDAKASPDVDAFLDSYLAHRSQRESDALRPLDERVLTVLARHKLSAPRLVGCARVFRERSPALCEVVVREAPCINELAAFAPRLASHLDGDGAATLTFLAACDRRIAGALVGGDDAPLLTKAVEAGFDDLVEVLAKARMPDVDDDDDAPAVQPPPPPRQKEEDDLMSRVESGVQAVKSILGDAYGEGYLAACLAALDLNAERVIEALLDNNPPAAVSHLSPQLAKIATVRGDNRRTGDVSINEAKRRQKARLRALEKQEQEDAALRVAVYDDDYDDRYDGLQEPTILTGDQDAVRRANALVRADEEEEAYWASQRNANSSKSAAPAPAPKKELTAKQVALQRRRKTKNKGAQHHQKDRAARKV